MMSEEQNYFQKTFNRYLKRNMGWVFIILTLAILFGAVFVYRSFTKSTKNPLDNYKDQMVHMQEELDAQEARIQELETQVKQLLEESNE